MILINMCFSFVSIDNPTVKILTAQVGITSSGLKGTLLGGQEGDIESSSTEIKRTLMVQTKYNNILPIYVLYFFSTYDFMDIDWPLVPPVLISLPFQDSTCSARCPTSHCTGQVSRFSPFLLIFLSKFEAPKHLFKS